jgi:hypothetical protein
MGPVTLFDKSALQNLSMDESVWFDAYFMGNMVPTFYVEVLADLEKSLERGKSPEELVGMLAFKTPNHSAPNVHHAHLVLAELAGDQITTDGRPVIAGGVARKGSDGKVTMRFDEFPEAAALSRWHSHDFLEIERGAAKKWRADLASQDFTATLSILRNILPQDRRITNLIELKEFIDEFCTGGYKALLVLMLDVLEVPKEFHAKIIERWEESGRPTLDKFVPYSTHVFKVDLLYYLGIERGFISGARASNKADMSYLYYLPFSMVFTSNDRLHISTVPLFLRPDQSFLPAEELKTALREIDRHFDALPDEIKARGVMQFAGYPPSSMNNVVTALWDKHMRPDWRQIAAEQEQERLSVEQKPLTKVNDLPGLKEQIEGEKGAVINGPLESDGVDRLVIKRKMPAQKGKWRMFSEEVTNAKKDDK